MILLLTIYIQCQRLVPMQEVECHLSRKAEGKDWQQSVLLVSKKNLIFVIKQITKDPTLEHNQHRALHTLANGFYILKI